MHLVDDDTHNSTVRWMNVSFSRYVLCIARAVLVYGSYSSKMFGTILPLLRAYGEWTDRPISDSSGVGPLRRCFSILIDELSRQYFLHRTGIYFWPAITIFESMWRLAIKIAENGTCTRKNRPLTTSPIRKLLLFNSKCKFSPIILVKSCARSLFISKHVHERWALDAKN